VGLDIGGGTPTILTADQIYNQLDWVSPILARLPSFLLVYTGNANTASLLEKHDYETRRPRRELTISATMVREKISQGRRWMSLVPDGTQRVLKKISGVQRIRVHRT